MAKIQLAARSRTDIAEEERIPFYLYIDEFQNFASESFTQALPGTRKFGLPLIMAHQTLEQVPTGLRSAILGNVGIQVYFRVGRHDAQLLAKEAFEYSGYEIKEMTLRGHRYWSLGEEWEHHYADLQNLPDRWCWVKHKREGGIILISTKEIRPAWENLGMEKDKYREYLN